MSFGLFQYGIWLKDSLVQLSCRMNFVCIIDQWYVHSVSICTFNWIFRPVKFLGSSRMVFFIYASVCMYHLGYSNWQTVREKLHKFKFHNFSLEQVFILCLENRFKISMCFVSNRSIVTLYTFIEFNKHFNIIFLWDSVFFQSSSPLLGDSPFLRVIFLFSDKAIDTTP